MSVVEVRTSAAFPSEVFIRALTEFGPNRSKIWGNSSPRLFELHRQGPDWAEVTEGTASAAIWQRYRYDWSTPNLVRLTVLDSNGFGVGSYWEYRFTPAENGRTIIDLMINRVPTTAKGRIYDALFSKRISKFYFGRDLRRTVHRLERSHRPDITP